LKAVAGGIVEYIPVYILQLAQPLTRGGIEKSIKGH